MNASEKVTKLTADAIRTNGLETAEKVRAFAKQARQEGEAAASYAEQVANAITEASAKVADRIEHYMRRCEEARASIDEHKAKLIDLPAEGLPTMPNFTKPIEGALIENLEQELLGPKRGANEPWPRGN